MSGSQATGGDLFAAIPAELPAELTTVLAAAGRVRIERILSDGHASPPGFWYDQAEAEFVLLVRGGAALEYPGGRRQELSPGQWVHLPAGLRHRVARTEPATVWLAVFFPEAAG